MNKISILLLCFTLYSHSTLISNISLPEQKIRQMQKQDEAFIFTKSKINSVFKLHCGIELKQTLFLNYLLIQGVRYELIFQTDYGNLNVTAITIYWENTVNIYQMILTPSPQFSCVKNISTLPKDKNSTFQFPELKAMCQSIKIIYDKLKNTNNKPISNISTMANCQKLLDNNPTVS